MCVINSALIQLDLVVVASWTIKGSKKITNVIKTFDNYSHRTKNTLRIVSVGIDCSENFNRL